MTNADTSWVDLLGSDNGDVITNGTWRRMFDDCVSYQPEFLKHDHGIDHWDYVVMKYPFVPGFHVVHLDNDDDTTETVLSTHKTLHEAMGVLKILLASGGVHYD